MFGQRLQPGADDVAVDCLQRRDFRISPPLVRRFVRRLDVDADQVELRQNGDGGATLGGRATQSSLWTCIGPKHRGRTLRCASRLTDVIWHEFHLAAVG